MWKTFVRPLRSVVGSQAIISNQRNVENFCLSEVAESSLEVSAHSGQLLESNNDVEPKKFGKLLSAHSGQLLGVKQ